LPLQVSVQPRTVHHETTIAARIDRRRLDVQQDTTCHVRYGTLTRVDVAIPAAIEGLWELDGDEVASRERMKVEPDGQHRYRLIVRREVADTLRLRFRYRLPVDLGQAADQPAVVPISWIRVLEGSAAAPQVKVTAEPGIGISLAADGGGWALSPADEVTGSSLDSGQATSLILLHPGSSLPSAPPTVIAKARALAVLPAVVASRLWLRTVVGAEGELRTSAWYRLEGHEATLSFGLPARAVLIRARVGGEAVSELERLPSGAYRLRFPQGTPTGAVVVGLEFTSSARVRDSADWPSPHLLDGGLVQDTFWELEVPWSQAVVGIPAGWTDENQWYWDVYVGKRRPWKNTDALSTWVAGSGTKARLAEDLNEGGRGGYHSYLFRRLGEPAAMRVIAMPRAWLVATCSGLVLGLGVLLLAWRPSGWLVACTALGLALAVAVAIQPSVTLLAIQSSVVGVLLTALAAVMQRVIDRRRPATARYGEPSTLTTPAGQGSSFSGLATVGSDESTAIRVRPPSTREHISPRPHPVAPDDAVADRSGLEPH
jgi:hypothetical protein